VSPLDSLANRFSAYSLRHIPQGESVARILAAAIQAVEPGAAVLRHMQRRGERLTIAGQEYNLADFRHVYLIGAGKASVPMARAAANLLGERLSRGIILTKEGYANSDAAWPPELQILEAGHPLPDERGVEGTQQITTLLAEAGADDLVIGLISGGGSALLVSPAPGVTLADLQNLTSLLLACAADIDEINTLRKHLDQVKGGGLAHLATPARLVALILSDVIGDPLEVIASGPTVPDPTTFADAYQVLQRYNLVGKVPPSIFNHLQRGLRGEIPETPKPGDPLFAHVQNVIVGSNLQAAQAALEQARAEGFHTLLLTTCLQGEARQVGRVLAALARQIQLSGHPLPRPACIVAGGEATVTLQGDGWGGRNQEVALGAAAGLAGLPQVALVTLATDGGDGPTDAAGAVVTGETLERARQAGLDPAQYLARNDSYHFFAKLDDLLLPGPTLTNVNDLSFVFAF
jgi:hydroxypyruvate reductase